MNFMNFYKLPSERGTRVSVNHLILYILVVFNMLCGFIECDLYKYWIYLLSFMDFWVQLNLELYFGKKNS